MRGAGEKQMTYIEVGPTTPEITEDGHNCKDSKPSEFVLKITQLHQHDDAQRNEQLHRIAYCVKRNEQFKLGDI